MEKNVNDKSMQEFINAAHAKLTEPWYRDIGQITVVLATIISVISLVLAYQSNLIAERARGDAERASGEVDVLGHELSQQATELADNLDDIFVYTSTYFDGQKELAFIEAQKLQNKYDFREIGQTVNVYEREDRKRWAIVIGEPNLLENAQKTISILKSKFDIQGYTNPAKRWTLAKK